MATTPNTATRHEGQGIIAPPADDNAGGADLSNPLADLRSGIAAWLQVGVTLGDTLEKQSRRFDRVMAKLQRGTPVDYGNAAAGAFPAAGVLLLPLGTPDQGTRWEVTNWVVGGVDFDTAAAGSAGLYTAALMPQNNQHAPGGLSSGVDRAPTLPFVAHYGTRQCVVNDQEWLFTVVFGGTVGQNYVANISATVFNIAAAEGKDITIL